MSRDPHTRAPDDGTGASSAPRTEAPKADAGPPVHHATVPELEAKLANVAALDRARTAARIALQRLSDQHYAYLDLVKEWQVANWCYFVRGTAGHPSIELDIGRARDISLRIATSAGGTMAPRRTGETLAVKGLDATAGNGLQTMTGIVVSAGTGANAPALFRPLNFLSKGLGGFVVGALCGLAYDLLKGIISSTSSEDRAAMDAGAVTADYIANVNQILAGGKAAAIMAWLAKRDEFAATLEGLEDVAALDTLAAHFDAAGATLKAPAESDMELGNWLREQWFLQHAGDEEDPSDVDTIGAAWKDVRKGLDGAIADGDYEPKAGYKHDGDDILKRTLFADQCLLTWSRLGLNSHLAVESLKAEFEAKVRDHQPANSEIHVPEMEGWSFVYDDARDYELFTKSFAARGYGSMRPVAIDSKNGWLAKVAVSLRQENGTYFVGEFRYELLNAYRQKVYAWTESPD